MSRHLLPKPSPGTIPLVGFENRPLLRYYSKAVTSERNYNGFKIRLTSPFRGAGLVELQDDSLTYLICFVSSIFRVSVRG